MKKKTLLVFSALFAATMAFAQQKEHKVPLPPPPPPPPTSVKITPPPPPAPKHGEVHKRNLVPPPPPPSPKKPRSIN